MKSTAGRSPFEPALVQSPSPRSNFARWLALAAGWALLLTAACGAALYLVPTLQLTHPVFTAASSFIPYMIFAWLSSAIIFLANRRRWSTFLGLLAIIGLVSQLLWSSAYWPRPQPSPGSFSIMTLNLRCKSAGIEELAAIAVASRPDILVLQGVNAETRAFFEESGWRDFYPGSTFHPSHVNPSCGSMVFAGVQAMVVDGSTGRQPVVSLELTPQPILVLPVDLPNPTRVLAPWLDGFDALAEAVMGVGPQPVIAIGDFNAVREHEPMRRLLSSTGLRDAGADAGAGWLPTFPATGKLPSMVAVDHILISKQLTSTSVRTIRIGENAHLALIAVLDLS